MSSLFKTPPPRTESLTFPKTWELALTEIYTNPLLFVRFVGWGSCDALFHNNTMNSESYVYWTVHHLDSWIKRDQLDVTSFIISLFTAQHVSDVNTSILRSLRLICWVISWVVLLWFDVCCYYVVVWLGWCTKLMRMDVLTSETCWALNNEIKKQVTSSWSLFIQLLVNYSTFFIACRLKY